MGNQYNEFFIKKINEAGLTPQINHAIPQFVPADHCVELYKKLNDPSSNLYNDVNREKIQSLLDVMIFFLPIKNNSLFIPALEEANMQSDSVINFTKELLEKGFLMVDASGNRRENPLYQPNAEALLHLARLKNLITQQDYFSALGALGLMESYSNLLPKRKNHPISYPAVVAHCQKLRIKHPDLFFKHLRFTITGILSESKEPIQIDSDRWMSNNIIFSKEEVIDLCSAIGINGDEREELLKKLSGCGPQGESDPQLYDVRKIMKLVQYNPALPRPSNSLMMFYRACLGLEPASTKNFIMSYTHPQNFHPVNPAITGFNFHADGQTLSADGLKYIDALLKHFKLDPTQKQALIDDLLALPPAFCSCYKLGQLGAESSILKNVAKPWLVIDEDFYFPSVVVFNTLMKHVTRTDSIPQPTQFLTGNIGPASLEKMQQAGFRPTFVYSSYPNSTPTHAHNYRIRPCMYTMHDYFYHLPKFYIPQYYKDKLNNFSNFLLSLENNQQGKINSHLIHSCREIFIDGDLVLDQSEALFRLNSGFTEPETNLLILIVVLEPLIASNPSPEVEEEISKIITTSRSFLDFSALPLDKCLKCVDFKYPHSSSVFTLTPIGVILFWKKYLTKNNSLPVEAQALPDSGSANIKPD